MSGLGFAIADSVTREREAESYREKITEALRENFRPEFLNRIDETVVFNPLTEADIEKIVEIQLKTLESQLKDRNISIVLDRSARKYLAEEGFDPEFGARPLKRLIQKVILDRLADKIIRGELKDGGKIKVNYKSDSLVFTS